MFPHSPMDDMSYHPPLAPPSHFPDVYELPVRERRLWPRLLPLLLVVGGQVVRAAFFIRRRDPSSFASIDPSNAVTIALLMLGVLLMLRRDGTRVLEQVSRSPLGLFLLYFLLCAFSALWSGELTYTLFRTIQLAVNMLIMCWIMQEQCERKSALLFLIRFSALCLACGMLARVRYAGIGGLFLADNATTCVAAMGLVMCLGGWKERILKPAKLAWPGAVFLFGLVGGRSSAANVSAAFGIALLATSSRRRNLLPIQVAAAVGLLAVLGAAVDSEAWRGWLFPDKSVEQIKSLHGRTDMWGNYYRGFQERPLLGYGFPTGEKRVHVLDDGTAFGTASAHNAIVSVAINTGIMGLVIAGLATLRLLGATGQSLSRGSHGGLTLTCVLATGFLNSLSYPVLGSHWYWPTTIVMGMVGFGVYYVWPPERDPRSMPGGIPPPGMNMPPPWQSDPWHEPDGPTV